MGAVPGTHVHTADNAVPPLGEDHDGLDADLESIHAGVDLIRDGLRLIALERHTRDETQTLISALMGSPSGTDILGLLTATTARLMNATTNPCLRELHPDTQANLARMAHALTYDIDSYAPRDLPAEAIAHIDPYADHT
jgi:hypothetical protein